MTITDVVFEHRNDMTCHQVQNPCANFLLFRRSARALPGLWAKHRREMRTRNRRPWTKTKRSCLEPGWRARLTLPNGTIVSPSGKGLPALAQEILRSHFLKFWCFLKGESSGVNYAVSTPFCHHNQHVRRKVCYQPS